MKSLLSKALLCFAPLVTLGQVVPPTSVPLEETRTILVEAEAGGFETSEPISNFRLHLGYSAEADFAVKLGDFVVDLPAGEAVVADLTYEHLPSLPATILVDLSNDPTTRRIEVPGSVISEGALAMEPLPGDDFPMDRAFTLMARFETTSPDGTLAALAPTTGKWQPDGKTLFLRDGGLVYDIGWQGSISGGGNLNDGREHLATLSADEAGKATLFVDGREIASTDRLTSKNDPKHVFKIGSTATDFAGDFKDGTIGQVLFWKRALSPQEINSAGEKKTDELNTPDFHWKNSGSDNAPKPTLGSSAGTPGYPATIRVEKAPGLTIHEAWTQELETSGHRDLLEKWGPDSFERGKKIYQQLCITCHGNESQEGSIPIALKFHSGTFKNGHDPFRMWQTLTKGYGTMMPMPQFSTRQKYDVIHYIREEFMAKSNRSQFEKIEEPYLANLPRGLSTIEEKEFLETPPPYKLMDFGNVLFGTYQIEPGPINGNVNIAQKGIAIRLDEGPGGISKGKAWAIYDHDTMRLAAIYTGDEFVDWKGIDFDGSHGTHTSIVGNRILTNPDRPGWAHPETGSWDPIRVEGKDGRLFGPLPRDWVKFKGLHDSKTLHYEIGGTKVLERLFGNLESGFTRTIQIDPHKSDLTMRVQAHEGDVSEGDWVIEDGSLCLKIKASPEVQAITLHTSLSGDAKLLRDARNFIVGGHLKGEKSPPPVSVTTQIHRGDESGPFAVDVLTVPTQNLNPHASWMRTSGFDFYPDGKRAAVCTWMGDVWIVEGIDQLEGKLTWKRICSGLFQPLGLKILDGKIHVTCRDQLAKLHDTDGDEMIDFIECLNNDHQVTEHFHEFAMGLQTDAAGNFYYAKSARHALDSLVPHHGTLLRVSADGSRTDILATGFRAANGVCLNPDGTFIVTDQEGHWNPKNRINWVNGDGPEEFFGNIYGYSPVTDTSDSAMKDPLCWITNSIDRSPSELLWVPENAAWGDLNGQLLNLSYGYGKIFVVPHETINGTRQGGLCELPMKQFPTGIMRGRFHPTDGQLYGCGMFAWAGTQQEPGGFYRIRKTDHPAYLPTDLKATKKGVTFTFSDLPDPASITPKNFMVKAWDLKRTKNYGSPHFNEREWQVTTAILDGDTVELTLPDLEPTWGMSIEMTLSDRDGKPFTRLIHNSIFRIPD